MNKKSHIHIRTIILLAIYLISQSPLELFHHHGTLSTSCCLASSSGKQMIGKSAGNDSGHKAYVSTPFEKCALCGYDIVSDHSLQNSFSGLTLHNSTRNYSPSAVSVYLLLCVDGLSDRGPPAASSRTV